MGLLSFFTKKTSQKAITGTPAVLEAMTARQFSTFPALGGTNINAQRIGNAYVKVQNASYSWLYLYSPPVRTVVDYISRNISQLGLKVYERVSDDEREHKGDHPAAQALRNPNPQNPGNYFIQEFVKCHLVYGNAYALKFRNPQTGLLSLYLLNPAQVGIVGQSHFTADAYRIYRPDGTFFDRPPEDVLRWPSSTGDDPRCGESYLETLRELIAADQAAQRSVTELHRSGLALPGWIERPSEAPDWGQDGADRFMEWWANMARNSGRHTPVLEEGMQYKQGGVTPEDAEFIESRRLAFEQVGSIFGMKNCPPESEEERRQFYSDVLPPFCELCAAFLDVGVLQAEYGADDYYFEFSIDEKLMGDDRLKAMVSAAGAPILTRNEARARLNLPAKEGGDDLVVPMNVTDGNPSKPSPMVNPIQDPNKPPQDGSHRSEDVPTPAGKALEVHSNGNGNGHVKEIPLVPRRQRAYHRRDKWAKQYTEKLHAHFIRQRQAVKSKKKAEVEDERWNEELKADLLEVSRRHLQAEGKQAAFRMASDFDPSQGQNWLEAKAIGAAEGVNRVTAEHIEEKGLTDAFEFAIQARAVAAGAGYATDVAGFATKVAIEQDGGDRMVTIDGGECEICADYQGSWRIDEVPGWPSYHPGCNCVVDIDSGGKSVDRETELLKTVQVFAKALTNGGGNEDIKLLAKAISEQKPAVVNVAPAETHIHEGAMNSTTTVEAAKAPNVTFTKGAVSVDSPVHVAPTEVHIDEGAIQNHTTVEPPPPANVNIQEGAMKVNVEAPPPAEVNVSSPDVTVNPAEVNVDVHTPKNGRRTVRFSDGSVAEINEETDERRDED